MIRLSEWIAKDRSSEEIQRQEMIDKLLSSFSVERNADVERFAHINAIPYEKANKGRTYILVDADMYPLGYFTLGLGRLEYSADIPERLWKKLRGVGDGDATVLSCILLGQLARNDGIPERLSIRSDAFYGLQRTGYPRWTPSPGRMQ